MDIDIFWQGSACTLECNDRLQMFKTFAMFGM